MFHSLCQTLSTPENNQKQANSIHSKQNGSHTIFVLFIGIAIKIDVFTSNHYNPKKTLINSTKKAGSLSQNHGNDNILATFNYLEV